MECSLVRAGGVCEDEGQGRGGHVRGSVPAGSQQGLEGGSCDGVHVLQAFGGIYLHRDVEGLNVPIALKSRDRFTFLRRNV